MVRIILSPLASLDLKEIVDFIKRGSPKYARLEKNKIIAAIKTLGPNPLIGKLFTKASNDNIRSIVFRNYLIVYEIISFKEIQILTIHHHARSLSRNPALGDEE